MEIVKVWKTSLGIFDNPDLAIQRTNQARYGKPDNSDTAFEKPTVLYAIKSGNLYFELIPLSVTRSGFRHD